MNQNCGHVATNLVVPNLCVCFVKRRKSVRIADKLLDVREIDSRRDRNFTDSPQHTCLHVKHRSEWLDARFRWVAALIHIDDLYNILIEPFKSRR